MKTTVLFSSLAALLCWTSALMGQVPVEKVPDPVLPPANTVTPAPATPVAPTPGGERRAIRREAHDQIINPRSALPARSRARAGRR